MFGKSTGTAALYLPRLYPPDPSLLRSTRQ